MLKLQNLLKVIMQFWMFAYNYKKGKFGGVTFHWNGHNKIIIFKNNDFEDNNYVFKCVSFEKKLMVKNQMMN